MILSFFRNGFKSLTKESLMQRARSFDDFVPTGWVSESEEGNTGKAEGNFLSPRSWVERLATNRMF